MSCGNEEVVKRTVVYLCYVFEKRQTTLMNNCNLS